MTSGLETYSTQDLVDLFEDLEQPKFRVKQLQEWIYAKGADSYREMTDLPKDLRKQLAQEAPFIPLHPTARLHSQDGSRKYLLQLPDGNRVEAVGMPSARKGSDDSLRLTACISTQVGCAMGCSFCATGTEGFTRNLSPAEIALQVTAVQSDFKERVSNVVVMGQGEPFLNYDALIDALHIINDKRLIGVGARHIAVSTCGNISGIKRFAQEPEQFTLAVSLHAARQNVRDKLMPGCAKTPLGELKTALQAYQEASGRRITFEYLLAKGINDSAADLSALKSFCDGIHSHVNLLPVNPVKDSLLKPSPSKQMNAWAEELGRAGIEATVRLPRGADIDAACGQLKSAHSH